MIDISGGFKLIVLGEVEENIQHNNFQNFSPSGLEHAHLSPMLMKLANFGMDGLDILSSGSCRYFQSVILLMVFLW